MKNKIIQEDLVDEVKDSVEVHKKNSVIFDVTAKESSSERDIWSLEISKQTKYPFSLSPGRSVPPRSGTLSVLTLPNKTDQPVSVESVASRTKIKRSKSLDIISQVMPRLSQVLPIGSNKYNNECGKFTCKAKKENANSLPRTKCNMSPEQVEESEHPETATEVLESDFEFTLFTSICISSTEQRLEEGKGSYTLYCIQYEAPYILCPEDEDEFQSHWVKHLSTVKRRFREFLTLHSRLEENQETRKYLKGIKGPSKWLMTPFSALDKKNIEERRVFLQSYLEKLCSREVVVNSPEMREFFAYGGDASIAYVRKTNEVGVPRIDKMLVRGVKGAIDLIRTALPSLPSDFIENIHVPDIVGDKCGHSKSLLPVFGRSRMEERHLDIEFQYSKEKACNLEQQMYKYISNFESASSLDASLRNSSQDRQRILSFLGRNKIEKKKNTRPNSENSTFFCENCASDEEESMVSSNDKLKRLKWRIKKEIPFADVVIDLVLLTITEPKNKYNKAKFVLVLKILFGQILNRWLEKKLLQFTTKEWCAQYLHFLHEALWPNSESKYKKDDNIHQRYEAIEAMNSFFSSFSPVLVSSAQYQESISLLVGSLQNERLNKCLVYHLLDILIDNIVSHSSSDSSS
ncbi:sorting nexin-19-like [Limulus polyphemus]|uniref:Sorting nexin-19-like n=1 Tax=Limulus polyphemus TaxID=6850 RepID=A0ABM1S1G2_LIMPO|nr:sorting nexin-19-like [Limulus polyphemus]